LALADALGNLARLLVRLAPLPGHRFDAVGVAVADKAFDSDAIIAELKTSAAPRSSSASGFAPTKPTGELR